MPLELDLFFLFLPWSKTAHPMLLIIFRVTNTYLNPNNPTLGGFPSKQRMKGFFPQSTNFNFSSSHQGQGGSRQ